MKNPLDADEEYLVTYGMVRPQPEDKRCLAARRRPEEQDAKYVREKLARALKIPAAFLGVEDDNDSE